MVEIPKIRVQKQLVFGDAKTGKTHYCLDVLNYLAELGYKPSDCYFAVIDADDGILPLIHRGVIPKDWQKAVDYYYVSSFSEVLDATKQILSKAKSNDERSWIVVDNMSRIWELVQRQFSIDVYGKDYIELLKQRKIEAIMKQKKGQPTFDRIHDFAIINPMHNDWIHSVCVSNVNFILTAPRERQYDEQGRDVTDTSQPIPRGQKDNVFKVDTMVFKHRKDGGFFSTIVGTRLLPPPYPSVEGSFKEVMKVLNGGVKDESEEF